MTDDTCTACHERPRDGDTYLCQPCADDFHAHIAELPTLAKELETELVRDTQKGSPQHGRSTELPLPFSPAASDLLHELRFWAVTTLEQFTPRDIRLEPHWEALSAMLAAREAWIVKFPTAGDVVRSLASLRAKARRLIDTPPERLWLGRCGDVEIRKPGERVEQIGDGCGHPITPSRTQRKWVCPTVGCGLEWSVDDLLAYRDAVAIDTLVNTEQIELLCGIKPGRVRVWASRNRITRKGRDEDGRPTYRYGDVLWLLDSQRAS